MEEEVKQTKIYMQLLWQISRSLAAVGAILFGAMMMVTIIDVGGRYFFKKPLNGAAEIVGMMLVIAGTWGIGYCQLQKMHIRVSVFAEKLPIIAQSLLWVITYLISTSVGVLVAWQAYYRTEAYIGATLGGKSDVLGIPFWPFMLAMAIGFTWAFVVFLIDLFKAVVEVFKR